MASQVSSIPDSINLNESLVDILDKLADNSSSDIAVYGLAVSILIAIGTWAYSAHLQRGTLRENAKLQRELQQRQMAIDLLSQSRFEPVWVEGLSEVFKVVHNNHDFDWEDLIKRRYNTAIKLEGEDLTLFNHVKTVLNYFEFIAVAVLNKAADEKIIRWSFEFHYHSLNKALKKFIEHAQLENDKSIYANFLAVVKKWESPSVAEPS